MGTIMNAHYPVITVSANNLPTEPKIISFRSLDSDLSIDVNKLHITGIAPYDYASMPYASWVAASYTAYSELREILAEAAFEENVERLKSLLESTMEIYEVQSPDLAAPNLQNLDSTLFHNISYYLNTGLINNDPHKDHFMMLIDEPMLIKIQSLYTLIDWCRQSQRT